jgi:hypothetical protein
MRRASAEITGLARTCFCSERLEHRLRIQGTNLLFTSSHDAASGLLKSLRRHLAFKARLTTHTEHVTLSQLSHFSRFLQLQHEACSPHSDRHSCTSFRSSSGTLPEPRRVLRQERSSDRGRLYRLQQPLGPRSWIRLAMHWH